MFDCVLNMSLGLDVNKVYFDEEPISLMRIQNHQMNEWQRCGKSGVMAKNLEFLCCHKAKAV